MSSQATLETPVSSETQPFPYPDMFADPNNSKMFRVRVCRNCQSARQDCICDAPAVSADDVCPIIYRIGDESIPGCGANTRLMDYLWKKHEAHTEEKDEKDFFGEQLVPAQNIRDRQQLWKKTEPVTAAAVTADRAAPDQEAPQPSVALAPNADEIRRTLKILYAPGAITELRVHNTPKGTYAGRYDNFDELVNDAAQIGSLDTTPNVYTTLQQLKPTAVTNQTNPYAKTGTTIDDADVERFRWLLLDQDPDREPSKISSTDAEKKLAEDIALAERSFLNAHSIESILADSGNGYHLLVRIDLPAEKKELVQALIKTFADKFETGNPNRKKEEPDKPAYGVLVDRTVFNPGRICKLYGTVARKGPNTEERPWRVSRLLDVPEGIEARPVSEDKLRALLAEMGGKIEAKPTTPAKPGNVTEEMIQNEAIRLGIVLRGPKPWTMPDGTPGVKYWLDCSFNPSHDGTDAFIFLSNIGNMQFSCSHNSCSENGTRRFMEQTGGFAFAIQETPFTIGGKTTDELKNAPAPTLAPTLEELKQAELKNIEEVQAIQKARETAEAEESARAAAEVDKAEEAAVSKAKSAVPHQSDYPMDVWDGTLIGDWVKIGTANNFIPGEFFAESLLTYLGAIAGHRIIDEQAPSQENRFYTVFLSDEGGIGKTTARFWTEKACSRYGLIRRDQQPSDLHIGALTDGFASGRAMIECFEKHSRVIQVYDELMVFVEKLGITGSGGSLLGSFLEMYDSNYPPVSKLKGEKPRPADAPKECHNSFLANSIKDKWNVMFGVSGSENSGMFQRLNQIDTGESRTVGKLQEPPEEILQVFATRLSEHIAPLGNQVAIIRDTPEATALFNSWYEEFTDRMKANGDSSDIRGRLNVLCQRKKNWIAWLLDPVGFVLTAGNTPAQRVVECGVEAMQRAIRLTEYTLHARRRNQPLVGKNDWAMCENQIIQAVKTGPFGRAQLYKKINGQRYGIKIFATSLSNLKSEGLIRITEHPSKTRTKEIIEAGWKLKN